MNQDENVNVENEELDLDLIEDLEDIEDFVAEETIEEKSKAKTNENEDEDDSDEDEDEDEDEDDSDEEETESKKSKKESKVKKVKAEAVDYSEDLDALVGNEENLSEDFRVRAGAIFEAAYTAKVTAEIDRLEEEYTFNLDTEVSEITASIVEKVDSYLGYVVEKWVSDNQVAIENGLRTEIAEDFIDALHGVFKENYIEVPASKIDLVDELANTVTELEESLNNSTQENIDLFEKVQSFERSEIIQKHSAGLTATEAEKLASLVEDVEFSDIETFDMKVKVIAESYFTTSETNTIATEADNAIANSDADEVILPANMQAYTNALNNN